MKVIYLSSTETGKSLFEYLKKLPVEIVLYNLENKKITSFPDYDLGIAFLYAHKIPPQECSVHRKWINFHPGPLPEFGGRNLAYHAIINNSPFFGATIHYMNEQFDAGDIIETVKFPILPEDSAGDLVKKSHDILRQLFTMYIPKILNNELIPASKQINRKYFKKTNINNYLSVTDEQKKLIRALTASPRFFPLIDINGRIFKIVPENEI